MACHGLAEGLVGEGGLRNLLFDLRMEVPAERLDQEEVRQKGEGLHIVVVQG